MILQLITFFAFCGNRKLSFFYSQHRVTFPYLEYCKSSLHSPIVALRSIVLTSCHVRQGLWSDFSHRDFRTTFLRIFLICHAFHSPNLSIVLISLPYFLNNQPDALIIPILFCYKSLHVSGIFSAHHQEFCTVHSALVSFMQDFDDRFQTESVWNCSSNLTLLGNGHQNTAWNLPVSNVP